EWVLVLGQCAPDVSGEFFRQPRLVRFAGVAEVGIGSAIDIGVINQYGFVLPGLQVRRAVNERPGILARFQWKVERAGSLGRLGACGEYEYAAAGRKIKAAHSGSSSFVRTGVRSARYLHSRRQGYFACVAVMQHSQSTSRHARSHAGEV